MEFMSHIGQDRWVAEVLRYRRDGYFLDFGAFDGLNHSNTFYLEKYLGWRGICVEPNPNFYAATCSVRSCITVNAALWSEGRVSLEFYDAHGLSSLATFSQSDNNTELRTSITRRKIRVDSMNPTELLDRFSAPTLIDYMSLDTEGAEGVILDALDMDRYLVALMTIEHNHDIEKQTAIRAKLLVRGYEVVELRNDDLFFHPQHLQKCTNGAYSDPRKVRDHIANSYRLREY